jgi:hypothetical protein
MAPPGHRSSAVSALVIFVVIVLYVSAYLSITTLHQISTSTDSPALRSNVAEAPLNPVVLIVLGNEPLDDVTPTVDTVSRVRKAVEVHKEHPGSIIILSGGPTAGKTTEARYEDGIAVSH